MDIKFLRFWAARFPKWQKEKVTWQLAWNDRSWCISKQSWINLKQCTHFLVKVWFNCAVNPNHCQSWYRFTLKKSKTILICSSIYVFHISMAVIRHSSFMDGDIEQHPWLMSMLLNSLLPIAWVARFLIIWDLNPLY